MIVIIDYGVGNLGSFTNIFEYLGIESCISSDADTIMQAECLLLPGVGAFDRAMQALRKGNLIPALEEAVFTRKIPILGVCLGMQILTKSSEEGQERGLGWIDAECKKITTPEYSQLKIPNNGWQIIKPKRESLLFQESQYPQRFYFNHSYHVDCQNKKNVIAEIQYGENICCAIQHDNIYGVQFHPEKSHRYGMQLLSNFVNARKVSNV